MKFPLPQKYRISVSLIVMALLLMPPAYFYLFLTTVPGTGENVQIFDFGQGQSLKKFAVELKERKVITSARMFTLYARLHGDDAQVKAGYYQFSDGMRPTDILHRMVAGEIYVQRFAVPSVVAVDVKHAGIHDPFAAKVRGLKDHLLVSLANDGALTGGVDEDDVVQAGSAGTGDDAGIGADAAKCILMKARGIVVAEFAHVARLHSPGLAGHDGGGDLAAGLPVPIAVMDLGSGCGNREDSWGP